MSAAGALLGLALAAAPAADHVAVRPAWQAFIFLREYWKLDAPSRSRFGLTYRLAEHNRPSGAEVTLVDGAQETPLAVTPDGWFTRLPGPEAFAHGAKVREVTPAGVHASMQIAPEASLPTLDVVQIADVRASVDQLEAVAHRAGPLGLLIPRFTRVIFSGAEGATAVDRAGGAVPLPMLHGQPVLDLDDAASVRTVRFTRPPYHVLLVPAGRSPPRRSG